MAATSSTGSGVPGLAGRGDRGSARDDWRTRTHGACLLCDSEAGRAARGAGVVGFVLAATGVGDSISDQS